MWVPSASSASVDDRGHGIVAGHARARARGRRSACSGTTEEAVAALAAGLWLAVHQRVSPPPGARRVARPVVQGFGTTIAPAGQDIQARQPGARRRRGSEISRSGTAVLRPPSSRASTDRTALFRRRAGGEIGAGLRRRRPADTRRGFDPGFVGCIAALERYTARCLC